MLWLFFKTDLSPANVVIQFDALVKKELRILFMSPFVTSQLHICFKDLSLKTQHDMWLPTQGDKYFRGEGPKIGPTGY